MSQFGEYDPMSGSGPIRKRLARARRRPPARNRRARPAVAGVDIKFAAHRSRAGPAAAQIRLRRLSARRSRRSAACGDTGPRFEAPAVFSRADFRTGRTSARDCWVASPAMPRGVGRRRNHRSIVSPITLPRAAILESGARTLGCAIIPAGPGNTEQPMRRSRICRPSAYCGPPDFLKILLDKHTRRAPTFRRKMALVSGAALAAEPARGVRRRRKDAAVLRDGRLGVIAFETDGPGGAVLPAYGHRG